jgi:anthranilate synthase component 1
MNVITPALAEFSTVYASGKPQAAFTRLAGDLNTPVGAYLKLSSVFGPGFLLESVQGGAARGRYSILGFCPDLILRAEKTLITIVRGKNTQKADKPFFEVLRDILSESHMQLPEDLAPMAAGIFGVMGYDCVREIENIGEEKSNALALPRALFLRPSLLVVFDSVRDEIAIVAPCWPKNAIEAKEKYESASNMLFKARDCLQNPATAAPLEKQSFKVEPISNTLKKDHLANVARAKEYITAGDVFQVALSQRFEASFPAHPFEFYRALRRTNPSPYLFYFDFGDFSLAGSSPEICVQLSGDKVTLRPIAGTIRRGANAAEDKILSEKLLSDQKERAEHLMLLDLGRNDVGRVAQIGTVKVEEQFAIEKYSEVMHIVSQVGGKIKSGLDCIDVLKAAFPAGTVSGAPKVRAMQIINELERESRGFYAGIAGYFSTNGDMDTAIILRTGLIKNGKLYVQAGGGIVFDSVPESEQAECEAKARALFKAAQIVGGRT